MIVYLTWFLNHLVKKELLRDSGASVLAKQRRSLTKLLPDLMKRYPEQETVLTVSEAKLVIIVRHLSDIARHLRSGLDDIEATLYVWRFYSVICAYLFCHFADA